MIRIPAEGIRTTKTIPLARLGRISKGLHATLPGRLELRDTVGSVKDRIGPAWYKRLPLRDGPRFFLFGTTGFGH
jgi:hypothetical protein